MSRRDRRAERGLAEMADQLTSGADVHFDPGDCSLSNIRVMCLSMLAAEHRALGTDSTEMFLAGAVLIQRTGAESAGNGLFAMSQIALHCMLTVEAATGVSVADQIADLRRWYGELDTRDAG